MRGPVRVNHRGEHVRAFFCALMLRLDRFPMVGTLTAASMRVFELVTVVPESQQG